jgi:restriction system protein
MPTISVQGDLQQYSIGEVRAVWNARYDRILRYAVELRHNGLHSHRELSAPELFILENKINTLIASWDQKFEAVKVKRLFQDGKGAAEEATVDAELKRASLARILANTLSVNDVVDWEAIKDKRLYERPKSFPEPKPVQSSYNLPKYLEPRVSFFDTLFGRKRAILEESRRLFEYEKAGIEAKNAAATRRYVEETEAWTKREKEFWAEHADAEEAHRLGQREQHSTIDRMREAVSSGDEGAVVEHVTLVLENSDYEGLFEKSYFIQYDGKSKVLKLEYRLPTPEQLPRTKSVKFNRASGELIEAKILDREIKANFESVAHQIALRTIHEIFESDVDRNIESVLFNGIVEFVDDRTGRDSSSCIMSVLVGRDSFDQIDLGRVDPKACFKSLKGVSAASLSALTPIPPIMKLDMHDKRFVEGRIVAEGLTGQNLATMSWEDFEHLVREMFEKEFASRGGEVRITQASRDGGVDAIAFDPDPITGGKVVIQAKRYTRTVGVSAVRDLYGTVMNEGASKGILVTTADYGQDAFKFASDKPILLMSGSNLLHLLEKHGVGAKIDLREAREART